MPQMIVDFEEPLPSRPREDDDPSMLDVTPPSAQVYVDQPSASGESHLEDSQTHSGWQAPAGSNGLNTTTLELPDNVRASMEGGGKTDDRFSFPEASSDADAALGLLAAEEPLGDVLSDGAVDIMPREPTGASLSAFERAPLSEFDLELTPDEASYAQPASPAASAETRITGELITADLPMEGQALVESASQDFVSGEPVEAHAEASEGRARKPRPPALPITIGRRRAPSFIRQVVSTQWRSPSNLKCLPRMRRLARQMSTYFHPRARTLTSRRSGEPKRASPR